MFVHWLAQTARDVPAHDSWLSARETLRQDSFRFPKRRADWRLGRWTAKCAVSAYLDLPRNPESLAAIEVLPASSGAPEVHLANQPAPVTISLSHSGSSGFCAVAGSGAELGCDLETIDRRSQAFLADYFTTEEQTLVARTAQGERDRLVTLLWSAKESVLKALGCGLRSDTLWVSTSLVEEPSPRSAAWHPFYSRHIHGRIFGGWWREASGLVWTLVADSPVLVGHVGNSRRICHPPAAL
jgi:4'-phosphopantetheinyl transferase